jgi:hypothetical protein
MLGPDSQLLIILLVTVSAGLLLAAVRLRLLPLRIVCGALSVTVAMVGGIATTNYYYGYYTTWGQLWADFHGTTGNLGVIKVVSASPLGSGHLSWVNLPGRLSGYNRRGLVYLPPQYFQARYARVRFPVVELFHGTPGSPFAFDRILHIDQVMDSLLARHLIGPMVLVMPSINGAGSDHQDCVNGPGVRDMTYLTKDVHAYMLAHFRVSTDSFEWGLGGYSSGGYCAADLAMQNRDSYGAAAIIEGYFQAANGPAAAALGYNYRLEVANSPLYLAERLTPDSGPIPAVWVAAGTGTSDYRPATMFTAALDRIEQVPFIKLNDARDGTSAWSAVLPSALTWLWQQLAPPDLRVQFPVRTQASSLITSLTIPAGARDHGPCGPAIRIRPANRLLGCTAAHHKTRQETGRTVARAQGTCHRMPAPSVPARPASCTLFKAPGH